MRSRFGFCTQNTLLFYELQAALYDLVNMPVLWTGFICVWFPVQCGGTDLGENRTRAAAFPHLSKWRDVQSVFFDVCAHRLILRPQAQMDGITARDILAEILQQIKPGTER